MMGFLDRVEKRRPRLHRAERHFVDLDFRRGRRLVGEIVFPQRRLPALLDRDARGADPHASGLAAGALPHRSGIRRRQ